MRIEILTPSGGVENTIVASEEFAEQNYPGRWRVSEYQDPQITPAALILQQIQQLEREQLMPRITRETILRLAEQEAAEMGLTTEQLIAKNKGYRSLKQFDDYIATLRAQL